MITGPLAGFTVGLVDGPLAGDLASRLGRRGAACLVEVVGHPPAVVPRLVHAAIDGHVDAIAFLGAGSTIRLLDAAGSGGLLDHLVDALASRVRAFGLDHAAVDPLGSFPAVTVDVAAAPTSAALARLVEAHLTDRVEVLRLGGVPVRIQGRLVLMDGPAGEQAAVVLSERERAVLAALVARPGVVQSKRALLRSVWRSSGSDEHLVEVTVGRLRQRLGAAGTGIETVVRRGYRIRSD